MRFLQTCLLVIVAYPLVVSAKRRRVSFINCPSAKSNNDLVTIKPARSRIECSVICLNDPDCLSASYCRTPDGYKCQLSGSYADGSCAQFATDGDCTQTAVVYPCENGGTFFPSNRTCLCEEGFTGDYCHRRYRDCTETPLMGKVYTLQPYKSDYIFHWHCGPETEIFTPITSYLVSFNGNFTRTWQEMKHGIPVQNHFFFFGLENLHQLTKHGSYDLSLYVRVFGINKGLLFYKNFRVDSEAEGYACHWDSFERDTSGSYSDEYLDGLGGAGDATKNLNGARFATYDNDINGCAVASGSGWWFNPVGCTALIFEPDGLYWPVNRTGTVVVEKMHIVNVRLLTVRWYEEDDLVL